MNGVAIGICVCLALVFYGLGAMQLREKGILLNNAYLFASSAEREKMDKRPHYRQSGICFLMIGTVFALFGIECMTNRAEVGWLASALIVCTLVYAIVSSVRIEKKKSA